MKYVEHLLNGKLTEHLQALEHFRIIGDDKSYESCQLVISEIRLVLDMLSIDKIYSDL